MGFNTVFFALNDMASCFKNSPNAAAAFLYYGCTSSKMDPDRLLELANQVAREHGEPKLHFQAIKQIQSFHASETRYFAAGGNKMEEYHKEDTIIKKDKKTGEEYRCVVLREPEWMQKRFREARVKELAEKAERKRIREEKVR